MTTLPLVNPPGTPPPDGATPCVMLLSVWSGASGSWFARVVLPDAQVYEFSSPFALVQFLRRARRAAARLASTPGLR